MSDIVTSNVETGLTILESTPNALPIEVYQQNRFRGQYQVLYLRMLADALREAPNVEGFQSMHGIMVERLVWLFVQQKLNDAKNSDADVVWKQYNADFRNLMKLCENLLKELRAVSTERAFKSKFVADVFTVLDRAISEPNLKRTIVKQLRDLVNAK